MSTKGEKWAASGQKRGGKAKWQEWRIIGKKKEVDNNKEN